MTDSPALPRRLAALLYDIILVLPIMMVSVFVIMGIRSLVTGDGAGELGTPVLHPQIVQLIAWTAAAAFFCSFWIKGGQTLGMQAWRIRLVTLDGSRLTLRVALVRAMAATVSAACFGLGYLWCVIDRDGRYWHDMISRTRLELLPKKARSRGAETVD